MFFLLLMFIARSWGEDTCENMFVPEPIVFSRPGDLDIAYVALLSISRNGYCSEPRRSSVDLNSAFQYADLLPYALAQINQNDDILPNVTLGYTVMDGCTNWEVMLARVWTLLMDRCHGKPAGVASGKLIGMIGPPQSSYSTMISGSLGIHRIPHIGLLATSDELSDKSR
jgi:hypothetical protein